MKKMIFVLALVLGSFNAYSFVEYNKPELLARVNLNDVFKMPEMSFISNVNPSINDRGDIVFKVLSAQGPEVQGLWMKRYDDEFGKVLFTAPAERIVSDPILNNKGIVGFTVSDVGLSDGIFSYNLNNDKLEHLVKPNKNVQYFTYPHVQNNGDILYRITDQSNNRSFVRTSGTTDKVLISEGSFHYSKDTSYLFKLSTNERGDIVFKRRIGKMGEWSERNPDEIVLLRQSGNDYRSIVIAYDSDADSKSIFKSFSNTVGVGPSGEVAFIVELTDNSKAVMLAREGNLHLVASNKMEDITDIELFEPGVANNSQVVFRAKDSRGHRSIFVGNTKQVIKVVSEGDILMTDKGEAKVLQNVMYPGFSGAPDINSKGEIVFSTLLVDPKNNVEWGTAIFKVSPK